ncbi:hypothetical protein TELCIR_08044 [Teladorsagia circumcincta]|uniref:Uncharacterized protein n=1 Tax=Teladorsagia circumcincta TaxID=45464 RepID=A0A2G9UIN2_TELCI|nr:hypothetical protein TELCIR_08044 [Teladorsagia circumcincta]
MWMVKQLPQVDGTKCEQLWNASTSYSSLAYYTVCCREVLRSSNLSNIRIHEKGQGWARDGWLTNSHWNPMIDFMFHGRKEADKIPYKAENIGNLNGPTHFPWFDTLKTPVLLDQCGTPPQWNHDPNLIVSPFKILQRLEAWRQTVENEYQQMAQELEQYNETTETI